MHRFRMGGVIVAALVLLALPVRAQDDSRTVSFDGVRFTFDASLGANVNVTWVGEEEMTGDGGPIGADPRHLTFTLYGERTEGMRSPQIGNAPAVVRAYRTADIAGREGSSAELEALRELLTERPDLAAWMEASDEADVRLPHLPLATHALQALRARVTYLDDPELSGIAYVVGYRLAPDPFAAGDFRYTFQTLSADGSWYVAGEFAIEAGMFPGEIRPRDFRRVEGRWLEYLAQGIEALNAASAEDFAPSLTAIDDLAASITFEG